MPHQHRRHVRPAATACENAAFVSAVKVMQGGYKPGKPGILRDFSDHGKLREFCATSGENCNKVFVVHHSNICVKQLLTG